MGNLIDIQQFDDNYDYIRDHNEPFHYVITLNFRYGEKVMVHNYCFFSLPSDINIEELRPLISFVSDVIDKPIYHLGKKAMVKNVFSVVHNLNVKYYVDLWLNYIGAQHIHFTNLVRLSADDDQEISYIAKEIYGNFEVVRSIRNPTYNEYSRLKEI